MYMDMFYVYDFVFLHLKCGSDFMPNIGMNY